MGLYSLLDKTICAVMPRVARYRSLAILVHEDRQAHNGEGLSTNAKQFLQSREPETAFRAYWEVQAQYCLIHADVFGKPVNEAARKGTVNIGKAFQWLKAADDLVDVQNGSRQKRLEQLCTKLATKKADSNAEQYLIEEYEQFSDSTRQRLQTVCSEELFQYSSPDAARLQSRMRMGQELGALEYDLLSAAIELPARAKTFFAAQGAGAACFDDYKDFTLDRRNGQGYTTNMRARLLRSMSTHLLKSIQTLTFAEKRKHFAFLTLGGLFQARELLGLKART